MDREIRGVIERATQRARRVLEEDLRAQLEGTFDVLPSGAKPGRGGSHLTPRQVFERERIVGAIDHKQAAGMSASVAVADYTRDAAFTLLNRFAALKLLEARGLVRECVSRGEDSAGYREFHGLAPGIPLLPDGKGYRLYLECLFDELSTEVKVLFDRRDPCSVLWPRRQAFAELLSVLNDPDLAGVWAEDETIGWIYQFFNTGDERRAMREANQTPQNSRELAVRNQFFTPRYVVQFLVDNTLGRIWVQMQGTGSTLRERCAYLLREDEEPTSRARKDPRDLKILDPACGSGHFLLYAFDLLLAIYEEAWRDPQNHGALRRDYPELADLRRAAPYLIVEHNLHGIDIDPRAAQIAALALWLRAQRAWKDDGIPPAERLQIPRTHIVIAEPMPGDQALVEAFASGLHPPFLRGLFTKMVGEMQLAGDLGALIHVDIADELRSAREVFTQQKQLAARKPYLPSLEPPDTGKAERNLSGIADDQFFHEAEEQLLRALRRFADEAVDDVRRRLFAGDATQGIALIEILRKRFDVILMNPPFGAGSVLAKQTFEKLYPRTKIDLYAAFVERGVKLLHGRGMLGAITSRTGFFLSSFQKWREEILLKEAPPVVFADLGHGVLDSAMVEVAAYCLEVAV